MTKYSNVIFDLDGTLLDTKPGIVKSLMDVTGEMGLPEIPENDYPIFIGPPIEQSLSSYFNLNDTQTIRAAALFREIYKKKYLFEAAPFGGIQDTLTTLRINNINLAIATYKRHDYATTVIEHFNLDKYCSPYLGSGFENCNTKTEIIKACILKMNADISKTVYIGDTEHDCFGAKEADIAFIGVTYGFGYNHAMHPESYVDAPKDILNLVL